jgi:hypothetical protein
MKRTERERQYAQAVKHALPLKDGDYVTRYHYVLADGSQFSAIGRSEEHAFRVMNAEHPLIAATFCVSSIEKV